MSQLVSLYVLDTHFNVLGSQSFKPSVFTPVQSGFECRIPLSLHIQTAGKAEHIHVVSPWGEFMGPLVAAVNSGDEIVVQVHDHIDLLPLDDYLRRKEQEGKVITPIQGHLLDLTSRTTIWIDEK